MPNYIVKQNKNDFVVKRDRRLDHNVDTTFIRNMYQGEYFVSARSKMNAVYKVKQHIYRNMSQKKQQQKEDNQLIQQMVKEGIETG